MLTRTAAVVVTRTAAAARAAVLPKFKLTLSRRLPGLIRVALIMIEYRLRLGMGVQSVLAQARRRRARVRAVWAAHVQVPVVNSKVLVGAARSGTSAGGPNIQLGLRLCSGRRRRAGVSRSRPSHTPQLFSSSPKTTYGVGHSRGLGPGCGGPGHVRHLLQHVPLAEQG